MNILVVEVVVLKKKVFICFFIILPILFYFFFAINSKQKQALFNESNEWLSLCRESAAEISTVSNFLIKSNEFDKDDIYSWRLFFKDGKLYIGEVELGDEVVNIKEDRKFKTELLKYAWFSEDMVVDIIAIRDYDYKTASYSPFEYSVTFKKYFDDTLTSWVYWGEPALFPNCPTEISYDKEEEVLSEEYGLYYIIELI